MTEFRTRGRGRNRKVYPIPPRGYRRRVTYSYGPPPELKEARYDLEELRFAEEKRMIERTLTQVGDIFLNSIFHLFSPLISTVTSVFIFGKEQIADEEVIRKVELIEKKISAVEVTLEKEGMKHREVVRAKQVVEAVHQTILEKSKGGREYAKKLYTVFLKSYASEVIDYEYRVVHNSSRVQWRFEQVKESVDRRIDQAVDCLVVQLLSKQDEVDEKTDITRVVETILKECLKSINPGVQV
jgi:hypothetical protein